MSEIHPVAAEGFSGDASRYESARPGYPPDAVTWLVDRLGLGSESTVADVGAGTGKLTRHLTTTGAWVIAVEPVEEMAAMLAVTTPMAEVIGATAESLPFADGSIGAITCAQAFHWFDADRAWAEFGRVLTPGGGVGLIWNARDRSVAWVDRVWSIMDGIEKRAPWRNHDDTRLHARPGFGPVEMATFWHEAEASAASMLDRVATVSHVAVLPDQEKQRVLDLVAAALPDERPLRVRYRVDCYVTTKT